MIRRWIIRSWWRRWIRRQWRRLVVIWKLWNLGWKIRAFGFLIFCMFLVLRNRGRKGFWSGLRRRLGFRILRRSRLVLCLLLLLLWIVMPVRKKLDSNNRIINDIAYFQPFFLHLDIQMGVYILVIW